MIRAKLVKTIANGLRRHALQPQALHGLAQWNGLPGLLRARILFNEAEDQFTLAARVTGVDQGAHVFALGLLDHGVQSGLGLVDGLQVEVGRDDGQMGKAPFAAFHVKFLGCLNFNQVAHRAGHHIGFTLKVVLVFFKFTRNRRQSAHDVLSH